MTDAGALREPPAHDRAPARPSRRGTVLLAGLMLLAFAGFSGLGIWQIERRAWKLDLIARVEARVHAPPSPVPGPAAWPDLRGPDIEYRHVTAVGRYQPDADTRVQALTERGPGFWILTPLRTDAGFTVLVNRGFVPAETKIAPPPPTGATRVTGLLRLSEPGGGFLRANDPAHDRWYSRDVAAIGARIGPEALAPFFIDVDAAANAEGQPVGGLTVVNFRNAHLSYALTWFALALLAVAGGVRLLRERERRVSSPCL